MHIYHRDIGKSKLRCNMENQEQSRLDRIENGLELLLQGISELRESQKRDK
jgi:hypothetical protein